MKQMSKAAILVLTIFATGFCANNLFAQAGGSSVPFLLISPDARASGMGETGVAIADDINAIYWNTGGLAFLDKMPNKEERGEDVPYRQVSLTYSPWLPQFGSDLSYSYGTYGQYSETLDGTFAVNFIFMNLGEFTRTAENGNVLGKFISNEFTLGVSYGTKIMEDLGMGAQIRYIQSNLSPTAQGQSKPGRGISVGVDIGLLYKPHNIEFFDIKAPLSFGFNLQNVGPKITYINESDPLPTNLKLGAACKLVQDEFNDLKVSAEMQKLLIKRDGNTSDPIPVSLVTAWQNKGVEASFGMEYIYAQTLALRAGYFTEPSGLGGRRYWNFGAGVKYDMFKVDFSFINTIEENHPLANTMRFSLLIDIK